MFGRNQFEVMADRLAGLKENFVLSINDVPLTRQCAFDVVDVDLLDLVSGRKRSPAEEMIARG